MPHNVFVLGSDPHNNRVLDRMPDAGACHFYPLLSWGDLFAERIAFDDLLAAAQHRLTGSGLWLEDWLRHQSRDDFWRHGSICEDLTAVTCPVLAVSGWADGYTNAVFRLLATSRCHARA